MVELEAVVSALKTYRKNLLARGQLLKAAAVGRCIQIVRALGK